MRNGITRRVFLAAAGATLALPRALLGKDEVPPMLDHILLGTSDLDSGIAFVEKHTGLRAAFGGVHPGRGTRNALLSLGERRYLEIIAPDPEQVGAADLYGLRALSAPRLITWAVHPASIEEQAGRLRNAGIAFDGPTAGARKRPDGRVLEWKTLVLKDTRGGLLPFFIEWSAGSVHPSADAPRGCRLLRFEIAAEDPGELRRGFKAVGVEVSVVRGSRSELRAALSGPAGELSLTS